MSYGQQVTFTCDNYECGQHYIIEEDMEMPPHWFGTQIAIADKHGSIPVHEREVYQHFCSRECLVAYIDSNELKSRFFLANRKDDDDNGEDDDQEESQT